MSAEKISGEYHSVEPVNAPQLLNIIGSSGSGSPLQDFTTKNFMDFSNLTSSELLEDNGEIPRISVRPEEGGESHEGTKNEAEISNRHEEPIITIRVTSNDNGNEKGTKSDNSINDDEGSQDVTETSKASNQGLKTTTQSPGLDESITNELSNSNSPLFKLFGLHNTAVDDPRYPPQRLVQFKEIASQLYNCTYDLYDPKDYLTFLGGGMHNLNGSVLDIEIVRLFYMLKFRWDYSLLESLKLLCDKLFFKGESQYIDRILEAFSQSWFEVFGICNGRSLYGSPNGVYLVAYSLIILNTDLHTRNRGPEKVKKITKSKFVKNTVLALKQNKVLVSDFKLLEHELKDAYGDLASNELRLIEETQLQMGNSADKSLGRNSSHRSGHRNILSSRPSIGSFFGSSGSDKDKDAYSLYSMANSEAPTDRPSMGFGFAKAMRAEETLRRIDNGHGSIYSFGAGSTFTTGSATGSVLTRFASEAPGPLDPDSSFLSGNRLGLDLNDPYFVEEDGDVELELQGPPWVKEGIQKVVLTRTVLQSMKGGQSSGANSVMGSLSALNDMFRRSSLRFSSLNAGQRLPWKDYFTVISEGQLRLFLFDQSERTMNTLESKGDGNWTHFAKCLASVNLNSCFAQYVHPDSKLHAHIMRHMQKVPCRTDDETFWILNLPLNDSETFKNYRRIFFCAGTSEGALEFCETCNFWAARTSCIPPEEPISSIEYGWSDKMIQYMSEPKKLRGKRTSLEVFLSSASVQKWKPIVYGLIASDMSMIEQLRQLRQYYCELELQYRHHKELEVFHSRLDGMAGGFRRSDAHSFFGKSHRSDNTSKNVRIIRKNYVNRLNYLSNELMKYKCYIITLQRAIVFRRTKLAQLEQMNNIITEEIEEEEEDGEKETAAAIQRRGGGGKEKKLE
ncbi:hypothetical protein FOA43_004085 [Brettanomyces nanus]|uniref:SEC7 domain-containing protein n=1 Tax=Eeniella nana TaxID=13502 RepID=A0A875S4Y0_EENNA|nr:uncharacterized protein FOA43_004085 [Brettanomyces nanus]QPG76691.1 hypothetical protein FOA43_004085 [Brettanomyces nanus]